MFYIIYIDTPFLLSLANIDRLKVYLNNIKNILVILEKEVLVI